MNTTYTIANIEYTNDDNKAVTIAHWRATAQDGDYTASSYGTCSFEQKDPTDPSFVPFDDLTEEVVLGWVQDKMGEEIESNLNNQMDALKNPTSAIGVPWNTGENNG
jgi:hypothetical protein